MPDDRMTTREGEGLSHYGFPSPLFLKIIDGTRKNYREDTMTENFTEYTPIFVFYPLNFANYDISPFTRIPPESSNSLKNNGLRKRLFLVRNLLYIGLKNVDRKSNEDRPKRRMS